VIIVSDIIETYVNSTGHKQYKLLIGFYYFSSVGLTMVLIIRQYCCCDDDRKH
jgi:hypothetical protein